MTDVFVSIERFVALEAKVKELEQIPYRMHWLSEQVRENKRELTAIQTDLHELNQSIGNLLMGAEIMKSQLEQQQSTHETVQGIRRLLIALVAVLPVVVTVLDYFKITPFQAVRQMLEVKDEGRDST